MLVMRNVGIAVILQRRPPTGTRPLAEFVWLGSSVVVITFFSWNHNSMLLQSLARFPSHHGRARMRGLIRSRNYGSECRTTVGISVEQSAGIGTPTQRRCQTAGPLAAHGCQRLCSPCFNLTIVVQQLVLGTSSFLPLLSGFGELISSFSCDSMITS